MKKANAYDETMIGQFKTCLINQLIQSLYDMLKEDDELEVDIPTSSTSTIKSMTIYRDDDGEVETIEVYEEYMDTDGQYYSSFFNLHNLKVDELLAIWDYINENAE